MNSPYFLHGCASKMLVNIFDVSYMYSRGKPKKISWPNIFSFRNIRLTRKFVRSLNDLSYICHISHITLHIAHFSMWNQMQISWCYFSSTQTFFVDFCSFTFTTRFLCLSFILFFFWGKASYIGMSVCVCVNVRV